MQVRATNAEEKEQRREAILDAAEQLWLQRSEGMFNVADIASAAGLAKGTVYLYFRSKEELFLALHQRHLATLFSRMKERAADTGRPMDLDDLFAIDRTFLQDFPAFLPIASLCHGLLERQVPLEIGFAFEEQTVAGLTAVVEALQQHFPQATPELMVQSYALFLGLWQLLRPSPLKEMMKEREMVCACTEDYLAMLEAALMALWRGALLPEEN